MPPPARLLVGLFVLGFCAAALADPPILTGHNYEISVNAPKPTTLTLWPTKGGGRTGQYFDFRFISVSEYTSTGDLVAEETAEAASWDWTTITRDGNTPGTTVTGYLFTATFSNNASLTYEAWHYDGEDYIYFDIANFTHTLPADTFKFGLRVQNWKAQPSNTVLLLIDFYSSITINGFASGQKKDGFVWHSWVKTNDPEAAHLVLQFLTFCQVDGQLQDIDWKATFPEIEAGEASFQAFNTYRHHFSFEPFEFEAYYDPDLTVVFPESKDKDDSNENNDVPIAVGVSVSLGVALLVVVGIAAAATVFTIKKRHNRNSTIGRLSEMHRRDTEMIDSQSV